MVFTRQRRLPFLHVLPIRVENLLDIVGRSYDGIDYVVLHDIHETMLDPGESDHPLAAVGVVAQTPRDVAANFYLHTRLAEVDVAVTAQLKAHRVLHNPMKPLRMADKKVRRSEAIREVGEDWREPAPDFRHNSGRPKDQVLMPQTARTRRSLTGMIGGGTLEGAPMPGMRRREFVSLLGGAAAAWPLAARAQSPAAPPRVGLLSIGAIPERPLVWGAVLRSHARVGP